MIPSSPGDAKGRVYFLYPEKAGRVGGILRSASDLRRLRAQVRRGPWSGVTPGRSGTRVTVALGVCGLMASADKTYDAIVDELSLRRVTDVIVKQSGCLGLCAVEPIVVVERPGSPRATYVRVTPQDARRIVVQHIINGDVVQELLAGQR